MFPERHQLTGTHTVNSSARDPKLAAKKLARVWYRSALFFGLLGLVAVADLAFGASSEAYFASLLLLIIPLGSTITT